MWQGTIRLARPDDLSAIVAIYNYEVDHGVATFDTVPWSAEHQEWRRRSAHDPHDCVVDGRAAARDRMMMQACPQTMDGSILSHCRTRMTKPSGDS